MSAWLDEIKHIKQRHLYDHVTKALGYRIMYPNLNNSLGFVLRSAERFNEIKIAVTAIRDHIDTKDCLQIFESEQAPGTYDYTMPNREETGGIKAALYILFKRTEHETFVAWSELRDRVRTDEDKFIANCVREWIEYTDYGKGFTELLVMAYQASHTIDMLAEYIRKDMDISFPK